MLRRRFFGAGRSSPAASVSRTASNSSTPMSRLDRLVAVLREPDRRVGGDLVGLLEQLRTRLRERGEALGVEPHGAALEVRVLAVEAARGRGGARVLVDDLQVRADCGLARDRSCLRPIGPGQPGPRRRTVVVLDRAAHRALVDELDQPEPLERAHVVGGRPQRRPEQLGELARARLALTQHREDAHPQRMAHRFHVARVVNALDWSQWASGVSRRDQGIITRNNEEMSAGPIIGFGPTRRP